ncbi:MAG: CRISPR-associated CARF protein Csa3 [Metallosphaera sp.]|uniref:CRISPR-associated CARF protein Csa3 n=1 Tax=Metallosphaera sp. TaxID=2020860 RepID=UPI00315F8C41
MACLISSIGFDEKFLVRSFLRRGRQQVDYVLVVKPSTENEKTEKAISSLRRLLDEAHVSLEVLQVDHMNFPIAVSDVMTWLRKSSYVDYILNLSSGMRLVNIEILTAFLLLRLDAEVEVEPESLQDVVSFRVSDMMSYAVDSTDLKILSAIQKGENKIALISKKLKIPNATVWRRVKELEKNGFLSSSDDRLVLKNKGIIFLNFSRNSQL